MGSFVLSTTSPRTFTLTKGVQTRRPCKCPQLAVLQQREQHRGSVQRGHAAETVVLAAAAATTEEDIADDIDDLEDGIAVEEDAEATSTTAETASAEADESLVTDDLDYALNFLWMEKNIAVAVDQVFSKNQRSPVTEYYFWPRKDAWEELKVALEAKPWISARDKVLLLNRATEVINFWQTDGEKPTIEQAQQQFPDCVFKG